MPMAGPLICAPRSSVQTLHPMWGTFVLRQRRQTRYSHTYSGWSWDPLLVFFIFAQVACLKVWTSWLWHAGIIRYNLANSCPDATRMIILVDYFAASLFIDLWSSVIIEKACPKWREILFQVGSRLVTISAALSFASSKHCPWSIVLLTTPRFQHSIWRRSPRTRCSYKASGYWLRWGFCASRIVWEINAGDLRFLLGAIRNFLSTEQRSGLSSSGSDICLLYRSAIIAFPHSPNVSKLWYLEPL